MGRRGRPPKEEKISRIRTTIYVDEDILALAKGMDINISAICREALSNVVGRPSAGDMLREAEYLTKRAEILRNVAAKESAETRNFDAMTASFRKGRLGIDDPHNLAWVDSTKKGYGFRQDDSYLLLARLKDAVRETPEVG